MNLHPIFVHFPIALLTLYALLELIPFRKIRSWPPFFYIKAVFVIFGSLGSFAAAITGEAIERQFKIGEAAKLVETHSTWALITIWIFVIIAVAYLVSWIRRTNTLENVTNNKIIAPVWKILLQLEHYLLEYHLVIVLAAIGLVSVTITGALGGAIAYGPDIDPAAQFFYNLLVK